MRQIEGEGEKAGSSSSSRARNGPVALPETGSEPSAPELAAIRRLVAVKWLDHAAEPDWTPVEQLRDDPQEIITVGIPVKETANALILAASVSDTDQPMSQWVVAETTMILKPLIVWVLPLDALARPLPEPLQ